MRGAITGYIDVAQIVLYAFWLFFAGLIFYLRQEDRREGYPLESDGPRGYRPRDVIFIPSPKTFLLGDGRKVQVPRGQPDTRPINAQKTEPWPGAPLTPIGDPLGANIGPGSYAERADETSKTYRGEDLIAPLRVATNFAVPEEGANPIGFPVYGADRLEGGVISDLWVDRGELIVRFYEITVAGSGKRVLVPVYFADVSAGQRRVVVKSLLASQFALAPATKNPDKVTLLEEDKIAAFYGGGLFYSTPARTEPLI